MLGLMMFASCNVSQLFYTNSGWFGICMLVVLLSFMFGGILYALSNLFPTQRAEMLKSLTRYEIFEAFLSAIIVVALFGLATFACNTGSLLTGQPSYTSLFSLSNSYVTGLVFTNGVSLVSNIYTESISFVAASNIFNYAVGLWDASYQAYLNPGGELGVVTLSSDPTSELVFSSYSSILTGTFAALLVISFAPLFLLFIILPFIQAYALTALVPVALIMRSLSFTGAKVREASNLFLAIAIGFYFVLPLTIAFNVYVASCLNINILSVPPVACQGYPLAQYVTPYTPPSAVSNLFSTGGQQSLPTTTNVFGALDIFKLYAGNNPLGYGQDLGNWIDVIFNAPGVVTQYATSVSYYVFLGLVMLAIDFAITIGFISSIGRGLNAMSGLFGTQPFWG